MGANNSGQIGRNISANATIGEDGRIFFKGGRGFGAWPDQVSIVVRCDDKTRKADAVRARAANMAALRGSPSEWTAAKSADLSKFRTSTIVTVDDITELESVITSATDEKPVQTFLDESPHVLTALLGGKERFCFSQKRLGSEYIPDFVIGDTDSLGVRWVLVELETPKSGIYLKDGTQLDKYARKGVSQIVDWRNWLTSNIAYARNRRRDKGLGLIDIRPKPYSVVLVGRRSKIPETDEAQRYELSMSNDIHVHTYDWLLEQLRGAIAHHGPPATNPYLLSKVDLGDH